MKPMKKKEYLNKRKIAAARVKIFLITRISGNKSTIFLALARIFVNSLYCLNSHNHKKKTFFLVTME